jgi:hypothetical protein
MYKVKFLERQHLRDEGGEPETITKCVVYSESEIEIASRHWKAMGLKRILEVECVPRKNHRGEMVKPKLSPAEVVELFYAPVGKVNGQPYEIQINEADLKVKTQLLAKYKPTAKGEQVKVEEAKPEPAEAAEVKPEQAEATELKFADSIEEKKFRKEKIYPKLKEAGITFSNNSKTVDLIKKLKANGIEI